MTIPTLEKRLEQRTISGDTPSVFQQQWHDLLFLHWEMDPEIIQKTLPPNLYVDTFENKAYVGIIPFFVLSPGLSFLPGIPKLFDSIEINFRTYVYNDQGIPGIWFYSLDINSYLTMMGGRSLFFLPYFQAKATGDKFGSIVTINFQREKEHRSRFEYSQEGKTSQANPGSLDFFLVERYLFFSKGPDNKQYITRVRHHPYELSNAHLEQWEGQLFSLNGFPLPEHPPIHVRYSPRVDAEIFLPEST